MPKFAGRGWHGVYRVLRRPKPFSFNPLDPPAKAKPGRQTNNRHGWSGRIATMKLTWLRFAAGMLLVFGLAINLGAQVSGRGSLSGLVTDSSGAAVPSASVTLTNTATGVALHGQSSSSGLYSFVSLIPGLYQLQVSQSGFQTAVHSEITVAADQPETINVTLQVGSQTETVTVSAAEDITATTSSTTAQVLSSDVIERIPLVQRDVFQLAMLSPGVIPQDGNVTTLDSGRNQVSNFSRSEEHTSELQSPVHL